MTDPYLVDSGLTRNRTELAWNRSGLAIVACVVVLLRRIWPLDSAGQIVALACISAGSAVWALALLTGRAVSVGMDEGRRRLSPRRAAAITVGTLALATAALVLSVFPS